MKKIAGLSPNQERIMSILEYKKIQIITRNELLEIIKKYMKVKDTADLIEKLLKKRKLKIIKKGVYLVIPFTSLDKNWALNDLEINDYLLKGIDYYVGLYNAFNLHHLTEQIPNKLFVFNTKYSSDKKILNYNFKYFKVKKGEVSIAFIGDAKMRKLNKIYRGCDKTTDILSFSEEENKTYLGEVLINYNQIKRQAKKYSSSIKEELLFILVHGLLHLLGYEDDTEKGREKMKDLRLFGGFLWKIGVGMFWER